MSGRFGCWAVALLTSLGSSACESDDTTGLTDARDTLAEDSRVVDSTVPPADTTPLPDTTPPPDTTPVVDTRPPEPGEFGYECDENDDCNSGWCIQTADGRRCTNTCLDSCPAQFDCREAPGTDATFICIPRFLHICDPCDKTEDCNEAGQSGNFCLSYGEKGRFCGAGCDTDPDCPNGYVCRNVPVGGDGQAKQCVPADGGDCKCSPLAKALQLSTTCYVENEHGRCEGGRFCTQNDLNACDAVQPFPESCNGKDDNCNGQTDEFAPDYLCLIENEFGACPGKGTCVDGVEDCVGTAPAPESCDGIDNDCDGETDEGLCDDENPCTIDFCNDDGECEHTPDSTSLCDDGSVCTQVDKCEDGVCKGFNPLPCGDGNPCYDWQCDPTVGCLSEFNTDDCEDGKPCTVNDKCNLGTCVAGEWDTCDDGQDCTIDSCIAGQGCSYSNAPNNSACGGSVNPQACSQGTCSNGACMGTPIREGLPCSRNVGECEQAQCAGGACRAVVNVGAPCDYKAPFCSADVPGVCTNNGECEPSQNTSCGSQNCDGIAFCCEVFPPIVVIQCCLSFSGNSGCGL